MSIGDSGGRAIEGFGDSSTGRVRAEYDLKGYYGLVYDWQML
jgi:hypothetical protein